MALREVLQNIDSLKKQADKLRPIAPDRLKILNEKLRLDWNYHSNAIEGNTLTLSETRMLLLHGYHAGNKLGRHYEEMKLHDEALSTLHDLVHKHEPITEVLIRNLHHMLMGTEYYVKAYDSLGQELNIKGNPGEYKTKVNGVKRIVNGKEVFVPFKSPDEVKIEMPELIEWYKKEEFGKKLHPVELAAIFHFRFVTLHPFDDGNGRMSRMLMNMILMRAGFVPAIITLEEREQYITGLAKAQDGESMEPFIELVANETQRSINLLIKAANGVSIDEPGDIDRQIELLKRRLENPDVVSRQKDNGILELTLRGSVFPILETFEKKCGQLRDLFLDYDRSIQYNIGGVVGAFGLKDTSWEQLRDNLKAHMNRNPNGLLSSIDYSYTLKGFKKSLTHQYMASYLNISFNEYNYILRINNNHAGQLIYSYDSILEEKEIAKVVKLMVDHIIEQIKNASGLK
jgi:Fic family protein